MNGQAATVAWRPLPDPRPLRAWSGAQYALLAQALSEGLGAWSRDWDLEAQATPAPSCQEAKGLVEGIGSWQALGWSAEGSAWMTWSAQEAEALARAWFGAEAASSPVVDAIVQACRTDAAQRLAAILGLQPNADHGPAGPPPTAQGPWSGATLATLPWLGSVWLDGALVQRIVAGLPERRRASPPAAERLTSLPEALAGIDLSLCVQLQGCELGFGELQGLRPGDVLRLAHAVDAPATVSDAAGHILFSGWLAAARGRRAVELAAVGTS